MVRSRGRDTTQGILELKCNTCGSDNPDRAKFCVECGGALAARCKACNVELPVAAKFCVECGTKVGASSPAPSAPPRETPKHLADKIRQSKAAVEGERKQVTVLFADVKGSMELAEALDPEAFSKIMSKFFAILTDGVERFEGFVDKFTGDGIMALFGAPIAHEDHAQRACYAALHLKDEIARYATELKREHGLSFSTRMGLNSGEVVVGNISEDLRMDYTAQGHTVGLAQRMENLAEPNTCFVSANTAALVRGYFDVEDLGEFRVKGVTNTMHVHRLNGVGASRNRFDVSRSRGLSRFVGRASDLRTLEDALEQTAAGNGQVIGVVAEAGTGKSRLCFEFLERCRAKGMRVFEGRAVAHGRNIPFLPILDVFRSYFGISGEDDERAARTKISNEMALLGAKFVEAVPLVCEFLGVGDPENPAPRLDPEIRQRQLIGVIRQIIRSASAQQPTVTMIEDLHWLDAASAEFLEHMVEAREGAHSLLLVNFRPEYRAEWMQKSWYRQIPLTPLDERASGELLASLLGSDPSIGALTRPIHARTSGNPFFIEEVAQNLLETGHLEGERGNLRLVTAIEHLDVPSNVKSVLAARIDRLAEREKRLLQTASVIGKDFPESLLATVAALPADELKAGLASLRRAEFVHELTLYPAVEYAFKHPLTQEVALGSLLQERRRKLHAAVAQAIEAATANRPDESAALLAHHWEEAGEALIAARWHKRAAEWAGITNASESLRHWERVRSLTRTLPRSEETRQLGITACQGVLGLAWRLGTSMSEADEAFTEGKQLAVGDTAMLAALNGHYAGVAGLVGGHSDSYWSFAREATRLADSTHDQGLQFAQRGYLGWGCLFAGRLIEGLESSHETQRRLPPDPTLGVAYAGYSPYLGVLNSHAWILSRLGRFDEALDVCDRAEVLARQHGDNEVQTWLQLPRLEVDICRGDAAAARSHARRALQAGEKSATPQARFVALITLGTAHRLNGEWDDAVRVLQEGLDAAISGANRMLEGWLRSELAKALLGRGERDRAEQEAQTAVAISHTQHSRYEEVRGALALALVLLDRPGAPALARIDEALTAAQALIDETGALALQAEVHEYRWRLALLRGDITSASHAFDEALQSYTAMGAPLQVARLRSANGAVPRA
jgi:adenylate cyclase